MSASYNGRPTPVIPFSGAAPQPSAAPPAADVDGSRAAIVGIFDKLEGFILATRQLEEQLDRERKRSRGIQEEFERTRSVYEEKLRETDARARELATRENRYAAALSEYQNNERKLHDYIHNVVGEYRKISAELKQYRAAWSDVLQREREAKMVLADVAATRRKAEESLAQLRNLEKANDQEQALREQAVRHAESYQAELHSALLRLHSSEAKYSEMSKELEVLSRAKRNFEDEVAKVEHTMVERFQWALVKEKEKMRAEFEREAALERERFREEERAKLKMSADQALVSENERLAMKCGQLKKALDAASERADSLEESLISEKVRFDATTRRLSSDVEQLRAFSPMREKLHAVEAEIDDRQRLEQSVANLLRDKEELSHLISESERRIEDQLDRIRIASDENTIETGPG